MNVGSPRENPFFFFHKFCLKTKEAEEVWTGKELRLRSREVFLSFMVHYYTHAISVEGL